MEFANNLIGFFATPAWPALSFLLGLWGGYRLALANDRRKEFNTAAAVFIEFLFAERANPTPNRNRPSDAEVWGLCTRIGFLRSRGFRRAWQRYCEACEAAKSHDAIGQVVYEDTKAISAAAEACVDYLKPR